MNPFQPGYGEAPPFLAGRGVLIDTVAATWRRGPGRSAYHRVVIGPRGTGKTVAVNALTEFAIDELGAVVIRWTAGSRSLADAISVGEKLVLRELSARWKRAAGTVSASTTVGIPGVATATAASRPSATTSTSPFGALEHIARRALDRRRMVIMWIDEAQNATGEEVVLLAAVMQELANVQRLPIALCAAGLPETRTTWIDGASSLERHHFDVLGNLNHDDTMDAIAIPIRENGRTIVDDALATLAKATNGFPYAVQLMGALAWDASPSNEIGNDAVRLAIDVGTQQLAEQLFVARWRQMSGGERTYLRAAAAVEDPGTGVIVSSAIGRQLGLSTQQLSPRRAALINTHHIFEALQRDQMRFSQPGFAQWVRDLDPRGSITPYQ
jgi:AAA ATPase domain